MFKHNMDARQRPIRQNKKNKCVSGNGSENFRLGPGTHILLYIFFRFSGKNIIICILKGILLGKKYNFMHFERHFAFQNA